jgi:G3E family GTPase
MVFIIVNTSRPLGVPLQLIPLVVLSSLDPVLREAAVFGLAVNSPSTTVLRYDLAPDEGQLRRTVIAGSEILEDLWVPLDHACISCAIREDAIPVMSSLVEGGRCTSLVLALPVAGETHGVSRTLSRATAAEGRLRNVRIAAVCALTDASTFEVDLLGQDRISDRGLVPGGDDGRPVAGVLADQISHADVVFVHGEPSQHPRSSDLIDHIRSADSIRLGSTYETDIQWLLGMFHNSAVADTRMHPVLARPHRGSNEHGAWTIELSTTRPFHPQRLVDQVQDLAPAGVRSFGAFWVPTRPFTVCSWEAAGGQLHVGEWGNWDRLEPRSRFLITGVGDQRATLTSIFDSVALTPAEADAHLETWLGAPDPLDDWLGVREPQQTPSDGPG